MNKWIKYIVISCIYILAKMNCQAAGWEQLEFPLPIPAYPPHLPFQPRIEHPEYIFAVATTPLIQLARQVQPPIHLIPDLFIPNANKPVFASQFKGGKLIRVKMNFTIFDFSDFSQATIEDSQSQFTRFIGLNLTDAIFTNVTMKGADFYGAIARGMRFNNCHFTASRFQNIDFTDAQIHETIFERCVFTECIMSDELKAQLQGMGIPL